MTYFHFTVDTDKCIKCQRCIKVCSSACLIQDTNGYPMMKPEADGIAGWHGCYRCQHCLAVCPQGAVSIMGRKPENSIHLLMPHTASVRSTHAQPSCMSQIP
ncbi:MAG: ATP-binding protein [Coprococcus sp.]